ncbi:MAG TPA: methyltransferase [Bryobacteraceae bacterium]|nr:methyltransferase [Bryobacteraceae bacterium]
MPFAFAGRLDWWRGWLFLASLLLIAGVSFAGLRRRHPDLLRRRLVRVQTELGHRVIATGPYRVVRHPMYSGLMLLLPGAALVLG